MAKIHHSNTRKLVFWLVTIVMILVSHDVMTLLHEWTHGLVAWLAGYKSSPFDIHYVANWITLWGIDEAVPYRSILAEGKNSLVAMIAIAPMIDGFVFFLIGLKLLSTPAVQKRWVLFSFFYWLTLMEISEIYSYIPIRTFVERDDIFNFLHALGLSPWAVFIVGMPFVIWGLQRMIRVEEARACVVLNIHGNLSRFMFLFITLMIAFWYFGGIAFVFVYPQIVMNIPSWISLALIPMCLIAFRRRY